MTVTSIVWKDENSEFELRIAPSPSHITFDLFKTGFDARVVCTNITTQAAREIVEALIPIAFEEGV